MWDRSTYISAKTIAIFIAWSLVLWITSAGSVVAQTVQYFPQLADGGGFQTTWYITGLGAGRAIVTIDLFRQDGSALILGTDKGTNTTFQFSLEPTGSIALKTLGLPSTTQVGWARITSSLPVGATEVFRNFAPSGMLIFQAGVFPAEMTTKSTMMVTTDASTRFIGLALVNVSQITNPLTLTLFDQSGAVRSRSSISLPPQNQIAKFLHELPGWESIGNFEGSLEISGLARYSALTVMYEGQEVSTMPVLDGRISNLTSNTLLVPAVAEIALAGMPSGYNWANRVGYTISAPLYSPVEAGLALLPGKSVEISATVTITVTYGISADLGPDAIPPSGHTWDEHLSGYGMPENGISDLDGPRGGLIGVFLGPSAPSLPSPVKLDFTHGAKDLPRVEPLLQQVFFIGSGKTSQGQSKQFIVPDGATRLYLATFDCAGCSLKYSHSGSFSVQLVVK